MFQGQLSFAPKRLLQTRGECPRIEQSETKVCAQLASLS